MLYREDRYGKRISQLGFGCMRFTRKGNKIDYPKAESEIMMAIEGGINYFDTAYIYPGSEELLGRVLDENSCRDRVSIATKLPQYMIKSMRAVEKTFGEQLSRLRTDHIEYYLMHMFTDYSEWEKLRAMGIEEWIAARKGDGSIGQIGFSYHGDTKAFLRILDAYDWDFCQIQYNYLDETSQAGRIGLMAAAEKGIPVIIMEPLRGGKLVNLPPKAMDILDAAYTPAELALRWLWDQPQVTCILSGMNSAEMIEENIRIASDAEPGSFDEGDRQLVEVIKKIIKEKEKVGCTGCGYCMPCPQGVDIPGTFHYYNLLFIEEKKRSLRFEYARNVGMQKDPGFPSRCIRCGRCETHCPQSISIIENLNGAEKALRPLPYRIGTWIARKYMGR